MNWTLCVDPGLRGCGAAVFHGPTLIRAAYVPNPAKTGRGSSVHRSMANAVAEWFGIYQFPTQLLLEFPRIYPGMPDIDVNDLLDLAGVDGALAATFRATPSVSHYFPSEWKGNVDKGVMTKRIRSRLTPQEESVIVSVGSKDHNTLDAVGIGLFRFGRLHERKIFR